MKKIIFPAIMVLMLAALSMPVIAEGPILDVVLANQNPYPVSPGDTLTIEINLQNTGYVEATDKTVEIMPKEPFTLLPGEDKINVVSRIPSRDSHSLTYRLEVSSTAPTNSYPIEFRIYDGETRDIYVEESVSINVEGEPNLVIDDLYTVPEDLEPGAISDVIVRLKNIGTGSANDLQLSLNSSHDEIKPILAKGKVYVGDVDPGETKMVTLSMSVDSVAEEKTYTVMLYANYKGEDNAAATDSFSVGLPVKGTINLDIIKKEPNIERGTIRIEVANKGTTEAKSLEAKLIINGETVGIDYLSSLKANKKTTFEFPLILQGSGQLVMDYIGPGIEKNNVSKDIVLNYEKSNGSGDITTTLVAAIVIIVIVYILYRKFFKKKRSKD